MGSASDPSKRVVVTAMGAVTPLGNSVPATWQAALAGRSGCASITQFDTQEFGCTLAGQISGEIDPGDISAKELRRTDRAVLLAICAAREALAGAELEVDDANRDRIGVAVGSGIGGLETIARGMKNLAEKGPKRVSPFTIPMGIANMASGVISLKHGLCGPNLCHVSACATGAHSIGEGAELIKRGQADVMVVGGCEAPILPLAVAGFDSMKALSRRNDEPEKASRPFDLDRDGFVMSEGAGVLVLESLSHARARGAGIRAEVLGYGLSADAVHMVAPDAEGRGAGRSIVGALESAGIGPEEVDYVNAHATSTPAGDPAEVVALRRVFGKYLDNVPISATKSMTGHLLGAAGAVEAILTILALENSVLPPTINLDEPDPLCAVDHVANKARQVPAAVGLSNSFGFGGTNASLLFGRADR